VHDAARPFASPALITRTIEAAAETGAALAAIPARDTVKQGSEGIVRATLARDSIFLAQTPQAFRRDVLRDALSRSDLVPEATDEATLAERAGHVVRLVEGELSNIKVTTPEDVALAESIARAAVDDASAAPAARAARVGMGYDLHRLVEGRPLILGGVTIPFGRGLLGYSDADAVCHAVTDAVLGAAAAGDIGSHFPDTDPQWRGASSLDLLRRASAIVRESRYEVINVDVVVIAEQPKLGPYLAAMRASVADALGTTADRISIKGKTNEGIGDLGRGEAIAVHAIASLRR
jgi:2-C-methyl-D-erythritol 4-phosphate cytidylyltransferase / 2-C-methyl-D-erythritol 2,4-cyclodiphosphate synthase